MPVTVVDKIHTKEEAETEVEDWKQETLTVTWEARQKSHTKLKTDSGLEFAISFAVGTILKDGDYLLLEPEKVCVEVKPAPEPVYVLSPSDNQQWANWAYQIGNRHQLLMLTDTEIVCPQNPGARLLFDQMDVLEHEFLGKLFYLC